MRIASILITLGLLACGSKKPAPTTTGPAAGSGDSKPAAAEQCCCELPADPPVFEMQVKETCQTDSHGVCQDDATKCKK